MKVLGLLLLLLVAVSSTEVDREVPNDITEYIEIVKCFLNQENLINDVTSLIDIIKSGEYDKLLSLAFKIYADGTAAVKECIKKEDVALNSIGEPPMPTGTIPTMIDKKICNDLCEKMYVGYQLDICYSVCEYKFKK